MCCILGKETFGASSLNTVARRLLPHQHKTHSPGWRRQSPSQCTPTHPWVSQAADENTKCQIPSPRKNTQPKLAPQSKPMPSQVHHGAELPGWGWQGQAQAASARGTQGTAGQPWGELRGAGAAGHAAAVGEVILPWLSPCCSPTCLALTQQGPGRFWARPWTPVALYSFKLGFQSL